jgi:hypothetical protein
VVPANDIAGFDVRNLHINSELCPGASQCTQRRFELPLPRGTFIFGGHLERLNAAMVASLNAASIFQNFFYTAGALSCQGS